MPERIQQKRAKGWRLPPGAKSVARPHKLFGCELGNPIVVGSVVQVTTADERYFEITVTPEIAVEGFRQVMESRLSTWDGMTDEDRAYTAQWEAVLEELRGRDIACFCKAGQVCHGDVWIELANR